MLRRFELIRSTVRLPRLSAIFLAAVFAMLVAACSSMDKAIESAPKPTARLLGAGIRDLRMQSVDLVFDVEVSNPYAVSLPLVNLNYAIGSGDQQLLAGSIKPSGSVPAGGSSVIQLPARVDLPAVLKTLSGAKPGTLVPYTAHLNVIVEPPLLGPMTLPLKRSGEIPIPAVPEINLTSFDIDALSLEKISGTARLRIRNTNQFAIDLSQIRFDLALGGKKVASARLRNTSKLGPGQSVTVDLPIAVSPHSAGTGLLNLLGGNDAGYAISGRLDVMTRYGELALPFSESGNTRVRHP